MGNLQVNGVSVAQAGIVSTTNAVKNNSVVSNSIINPNSTTQKSGKQKFLDTVNSYLQTPYLNTSVVKDSDGNKFLKISRDENDQTRPNDRGDFCMETLKRKLGLSDGVIKKYNDSYSVTDRAEWSDGATIEKGASMKVPVSEIGQTYHFLRGSENIALREAVKQIED